MIYFDHNASSPLSQAARQAWLEAVEQFPANPSSQHRLGQRADKALELAREELGALLGCDPQQIIWTSGATESNNLALHQFLDRGNEARPIIASPLEHPSIREPLQQRFPNHYVQWPVDPEGTLDHKWLCGILSKTKPMLVIAMAANNETGVINDLEWLADVCQTHAIPVLCDATQYLGRYSVGHLGKCGFVSGSGHKFGGPRGIGFLKLPSSNRTFKPMLVGGAQEANRRSGTENLPSILAMVAALREAGKVISQPSFVAEREHWKHAFENRMVTSLPGTRVVGSGAKRLWNTSMLIMPQLDCRHRWVVRLDRKGIAASTGSACASGNEAPSETLLALGYTSQEAGRALRFSSSYSTQRSDWEELARIMESIHSEFNHEPQPASSI